MSDGLEFAWDWRLGVGSLLCFLGGALCAGGGIGGGAFYLSAFMLVCGFDAHYAVPLSKITILGVAIGGLVVLLPQRHPHSSRRPLIDFDVALVLEPTVMLGTVIGVFFNVVSPTWVIVVCLSVLFTVTSYRTVKKGLTLYRKEKAAELARAAEINTVALDKGASRKAAAATTTTSAGAATLAGGSSDETGESSSVPIVGQTDELHKEAAEAAGDEGEEEEEKGDEEANIESVIPELPPQKATFWTIYRPLLPKFGVMLVVIAGMFVFLTLKGGSSGTSVAGIACGSTMYWVLVALVIPYLGAAAAGVVAYLRRHPKMPLLEGDLTYTPKQLAGMVGGGIGGGIVSAFLGVGGGVVIGPLLLDLGLIPQVSTATSSFMILFTSSSSSFQYVLMGKIPPAFMAWYFMVGFFSAIVGQLFVVWLVKKTGKQSFVNFMLAAVIIISTLAMIILLVVQFVGDVKQGKYLGFHPICSVPESSSDSFSSWSSSSSSSSSSLSSLSSF